MELVPADKLTTEAFAMKPSSLNMQSAGWKLDGVPVPEDQINNIVISPGQTLVMEAVTKASVREGVTGSLAVSGYPNLSSAVGQDPAFTIGLQHNGESVNSGDGAYVDKNVGENLLETASTTQVIITMLPLSSSVYDDPSVGRNKTFNLSEIGMYLAHN